MIKTQILFIIYPYNMDLCGNAYTFLTNFNITFKAPTTRNQSKDISIYQGCPFFFLSC